MPVKQDYLMRMIENMVRFIAQLLLGKNRPDYILPDAKDYNETDDLYARIIRLADCGKINEAENELLEYIEGREPQMCEMALSFYLHLSELDGEFLDEHDYSKEEVKDGIEALAKKCGITV